MILSFGDDETRKIAGKERSRRLPPDIQQTAYRKLSQLAAATSLQDLAFPGNHLETLKGDRKGQYSIRINRQWRVCFRWTHEGVCDVGIADYH